MVWHPPLVYPSQALPYFLRPWHFLDLLLLQVHYLPFQLLFHTQQLRLTGLELLKPAAVEASHQQQSLKAASLRQLFFLVLDAGYFVEDPGGDLPALGNGVLSVLFEDECVSDSLDEAVELFKVDIDAHDFL